MRIWHEQLIPLLCRQHLLACWREGLGAYKIITENMDISYARHPATLEFQNCPEILYQVLETLRQEMLARGYKPKELPTRTYTGIGKRIPWQTLEQQIEVLKSKKCECRVN